MTPDKKKEDDALAELAEHDPDFEEIARLLKESSDSLEKADETVRDVNERVDRVRRASQA